MVIAWDSPVIDAYRFNLGSKILKIEKPMSYLLIACVNLFNIFSWLLEQINMIKYPMWPQ